MSNNYRSAYEKVSQRRILSANTKKWLATLTTLTAVLIVSSPIAEAGAYRTVTLPFTYSFSVNGTMSEAASPDKSSSPYWWLQNGAKIFIEGGRSHTIMGSLASTDPFRNTYARTSPIASDDGYHPQNLFRLFFRQPFKEAAASIYVEKTADNLDNPLNRKPWNGISIIGRYLDSGNYYYAGLRADGGAVIKKAANGVFHTLAYTKALSGTYVANSAVSLIPNNTWIGLKLEIGTDASGNPKLIFYTDEGKTGLWKKVIEAIDDPAKFGTPINSQGMFGIETDFADAVFDDFTISDRLSTVPATATSSPTDTVAPKTALNLFGLSPSRTVTETGTITDSTDSDWWVNSGAYFKISDNIGSTVQGSLPANDYWRNLYAASNPTDTDNGYHPQNIFRLISKDSLENLYQEGYFTVKKSNLSGSPNRDGHNGILFFSRYKDSDNLYYIGLRVDGNAVIKKKVGGSYYTLALKKIYDGNYDRSSNPSLLPLDKPIGLRSEVRDLADGSVEIKLYVDKENNGSWQLAASAVDSGAQGKAVKGIGHFGIRTDFMDVEVASLKVDEL